MTAPVTPRVWCPDQEEEHDGDVIVPDHGWSPSDMAEEHAEEVYREEPFEELRVHVRTADGELHRFAVRADVSATFTATEAVSDA